MPVTVQMISIIIATTLTVAYLCLVDMAVDLSMGKKSCVRVFASLAWKPGAGLRRLESVGVS